LGGLELHRNRKGQIIQVSEQSVVKRYFIGNVARRVSQDMRALDYLEKTFGEV